MQPLGRRATNPTSIRYRLANSTRSSPALRPTCTKSPQVHDWARAAKCCRPSTPHSLRWARLTPPVEENPLRHESPIQSRRACSCLGQVWRSRRDKCAGESHALRRFAASKISRSGVDFVLDGAGFLLGHAPTPWHHCVQSSRINDLAASQKKSDPEEGLLSGLLAHDL